MIINELWMHIWKQNCGPVSQIKRSSTWENKMGFPKNQVLPLTHQPGQLIFGSPGVGVSESLLCFTQSWKNKQLDRYKPLQLPNSLDVVLADNRHFFLVRPLKGKQLGFYPKPRFYLGKRSFTLWIGVWFTLITEVFQGFGCTRYIYIYIFLLWILLLKKKTFLNSPPQKKQHLQQTCRCPTCSMSFATSFPRLRGICPMAIGRLAMANKEPVGF